jgi:hypothetical protein
MTLNSFGPFSTQPGFLSPNQQFPEDPKLFREILINREKITAYILNGKENAKYERVELVTGQEWFTTVQDGIRKSNSVLRLTFDLIAFNGGIPIPNGVTTLPLQADPSVMTPVLIKYFTSINPVHGFGAAVIGTTFYFLNDPQIYVRFIDISTTNQSVQITNTTGSPITQMVWVFEYWKV